MHDLAQRAAEHLAALEAVQKAAWRVNHVAVVTKKQKTKAAVAELLVSIGDMAIALDAAEETK